jgi:hypothetical protein
MISASRRCPAIRKDDCSGTRIYRPGMPPCWAIAAFCSWNLSPNRCEAFMDLSTHRMTQLSSLEVRDLLSKLLTQSLKQFCTRLEYIWMPDASGSGWINEYTPEVGPDGWGSEAMSYVHEFFHLLLLHASLQLTLFRCGETMA